MYAHHYVLARSSTLLRVYIPLLFEREREREPSYFASLCVTYVQLREWKGRYTRYVDDDDLIFSCFTASSSVRPSVLAPSAAARIEYVQPTNQPTNQPLSLSRTQQQQQQQHPNSLEELCM